jgi:hypothetical protein
MAKRSTTPSRNRPHNAQGKFTRAGSLAESGAARTGKSSMRQRWTLLSPLASPGAGRTVRSGRLDETLVVVAAEFGRSPKVTRSNGGREHWADCYSVLFAGGGIEGGRVHGQSDKNAAYPTSNPTTPADFTATIYHCLGLDPRSETHDQGDRPLVLSKGTPITTLVG